ncbi:MAG: pilus assembly protein TadG-related protein [Acidobacteriaceae bacterium]
MENVNGVRRAKLPGSRLGQRGQTMIFVVLGLALVFLAVLGFAIDFGNLWFKRQSAQAAADAACTAAVMDILYNVQNNPPTKVGGFTVGTAFNCSTAAPPPACGTEANPNSDPSCHSASGSGPCAYAALNGYSGGGLVNNTASNTIEVTFPSSITGIDPFSSLGPGGATAPPASLVPNPFIQVKVTDRISSGFFGLVSNKRTIDVPAKASCAILATTSPIPLLILDPHRDTTFKLTGGSGLNVWGGPQDSIQVNSDSQLAVKKAGNGKVQIDLSLGGPNNTGSNFHVTGWEQTATPKIVATNAATCDTSTGGPDVCLGTTGSYASHAKIQDPLASVSAPNKPLAALTRDKNTEPLVDSDLSGGTEGCPAPAGMKCREFRPGYYPGGINVSGSSANPYYAIFQPGIYYIEKGMSFGQNTCARPAFAQGDGSGGTFFYFADSKSINVSGGGCTCLTCSSSGGLAPAVPFNVLTTSGKSPYQYGAACDLKSYTGLPTNLTSSNPITGSVLLAPCTGPTVASLCASSPGDNCSINGGNGFGDQLGSTDPAGIQRGILFMQNRGVDPGPPSNQPNWQGGGAFLLSGAMYFHQCHLDGTTTGTGCDDGPTNEAYNDILTIGGNASGSSYVLGNIIVDKMVLNGTPNFYLDLSPYAQYVTLKASLVQ